MRSCSTDSLVFTSFWGENKKLTIKLVDSIWIPWTMSTPPRLGLHDVFPQHWATLWWCAGGVGDVGIQVIGWLALMVIRQWWTLSLLGWVRFAALCIWILQEITQIGTRINMSTCPLSIDNWLASNHFGASSLCSCCEASIIFISNGNIDQLACLKTSHLIRPWMIFPLTLVSEWYW